MTSDTTRYGGRQADGTSNERRPSRRRFLQAVGTAGGVVALSGLVGGTSVSGTRFGVTDESTGDAGDEASVAVGRDAVHVEGRLPADVACTTARLGDVRFEGETLIVPVGLTVTATILPECDSESGSLAYAADVEVADPPATVVVEHHGNDEWTREFEVGDLAALPASPVPTDLAVTSVSVSSVTLEWTAAAVDAPKTAQVDRWGVLVDGDLDHVVDDPATRETIVTGLDPDATYEVAVVGAVAEEGTTDRATATVSTTAFEGDLPPVGGNDAAPTDPDGDHRYEDVNGNGEGDLADAVDLFQHRESDAVLEHVQAYDFGGNDRIDLADVVSLFQEITA